MNLDIKYNHLLVEKNKYTFWLKNGYFEPGDKTKKPFSIVMPPPNITGKLHLGHAWDGTLQDIIIRYKKLQGFDTLWLPGIDHAGISMQRKVEEKLRNSGYDTSSLTKDDFFTAAFKWKTDYEYIIYEQWAKLGLALSYQYKKFTMEEEYSQAVRTAFVKMYKQGFIYRGNKIVNWDCIQKTAISNIEVIYKNIQGKMYYFKYFLENKQDYLVIATTRPETMFGDVCVVINPGNHKLSHFIGQRVYNPANNQLMPIIGDKYVDNKFGTGVMKCTPAHDINDYQIGLRHNLLMPICINSDGTMNELAGKFAKLDRFVCRVQLVKQFKEQKIVVKIEEHNYQVGHSERSGSIIEPLLSLQWFVKMNDIANEAIIAQKKDGVNFVPSQFAKIYFNWMGNTFDWCISRQLLWGHKIPAWIHNTTKKLYVGIKSPQDIANYQQDKDVLDTWFSSALWPFAALGWPKENDDNFKRFYPTNVLVTGYDIIFFWVARMMFQAKFFTNKKPFNDLLIHGLIRASDGQKMSKSLGNGVDPMDIIEKNGCDAMRHFLATNSAPGLDLRYDEIKIKSSWNFINKIWNISRYVLITIDENSKPIVGKNLATIDYWIIAKLNGRINRISQAMEKYEFGICNKEIFNFIYDDFASVYIELSKVLINKTTKNTLLYVLVAVLKIIHPIMPFVSEHIYQLLPESKKSILEDNYPQIIKVNSAPDIDVLNNLILEIRKLRISNNIKMIQKLNIGISYHKKPKTDFTIFLKQLVNTNIIKQINGDKIPFNGGTIFINLNDFINLEAKKKKLNEKLDKINQKIIKLENILTNKEFIKKAQLQIVLNYKSELKTLKINKNILLIEIKKFKILIN